MKKNILLSFLFILTVSQLPAQVKSKTGLVFENLTYEQALAKSKAENKPVFLHGFASWCHFCEYMVDSVYPDTEVGDFFNKNFICIKSDLEKDGVELNKRLKASSYPQFVFFDSTGQILHRVAGQKAKSTFMQVGKDALDPSKQMRSFEVKYRNHTINEEDVSIYFKMLANAAIEYQPAVNGYLMRLPDTAFINSGNWRIINDFLRDVDMPAMTRFLKNRKEFSAKYTADSIDNRIINNYNASLMMIVQHVDTNAYNTLIKKISQSGLDLSNKIIAYSELNKHKMKSEWKEYQESAPAFVEKYCKGDHRRLNELAYNIYERGQSNELILKAESWAKEATRLNDNYRYNHTLACLEFKLGKKDEALAAANHAIELGKKINADTKQTILLLDKINEM